MYEASNSNEMCGYQILISYTIIPKPDTDAVLSVLIKPDKEAVLNVLTLVWQRGSA